MRKKESLALQQAAEALRTLDVFAPGTDVCYGVYLPNTKAALRYLCETGIEATLHCIDVYVEDMQWRAAQCLRALTVWVEHPEEDANLTPYIAEAKLWAEPHLDCALDHLSSTARQVRKLLSAKKSLSRALDEECEGARRGHATSPNPLPAERE